MSTQYQTIRTRAGCYVGTMDGAKVYPVTGWSTWSKCEAWIEKQTALEFDRDNEGTVTYPADFDPIEMLVNRIQGDIALLSKERPDHWIVKLHNAPLRDARTGKFTKRRLPWFLRRQAD